MSLKVVGAGVGRTGTESLKIALERLLGGPCYHMLEVLGHPDFLGSWAAIGRGETPDWDAVFDGYVAAVDWPAAAFWPELSEKYPDALVLLSTRESAEVWWRSASATIFGSATQGMLAAPDAADMFGGIMGRFTLELGNPEAAMAAYDAHNQKVRDTIPADRLIEWKPGDGWAPIAQRLGLAVPDEAFPHVNTTEMFIDRQQQMAEHGEWPGQ
jgi:hypothetical protein